MKRIIMMLIACAMGVAAQAASVSWAINNVYGYNDPGLSDAPNFYDNYCAYLIDTADFSNQITASNYRDAIAKATSSAGLSRVATFRRARMTQPVDIDYGVGQGSFVTLIIDNTLGQETSFVVSDLATVSTGNLLSFNFYSITYGKEWTPGAVPEPSSAMLLLLGFAGLALKRRRT